MVVCMKQGADLHMAQLMPLTVSCFSKIQIGFTFLVPAHLGIPGKKPLNGCVYGHNMNPTRSEHTYRHIPLHTDGDLKMFARCTARRDCLLTFARSRVLSVSGTYVPVYNIQTH